MQINFLELAVGYFTWNLEKISEISLIFQENKYLSRRVNHLLKDLTATIKVRIQILQSQLVVSLRLVIILNTAFIFYCQLLNFSH